MIKKTFLLLTMAVINLIAFSQEKTELEGTITGSNDLPLAGVHIFINEAKTGTSTNDLGAYNLSDLLPGGYKIGFSYTGFESQTIDVVINNGANTLNIVLHKTSYDLQGVVVSAQKREQQIIDVPISMSAISNQSISELAIQDLDHFADLIPGLNVRVQSNQRPSFVIRGLSSDEVSPNAQPRVSLFINNAPITRASGGVLELYDMERIEVLKGPQGTLFGRGAQIGAIHFLTKMPDNKFGGYISIGQGSYSQTNINTAINIPIIKDKLHTRLAAVYHTQDGYVNNTFGGKLNGKDTKGLRFSTRYLPSNSTKIDFVFNYQKDDAPGVSFISGIYPNTNGVTDIFSYEASLEKAEELKATKDVISAVLNIRHYFTNNLYLTAITSYQTNESFERWDGDGSAAEAIDMSEAIDANLFNQEVRLNYSIGTKFTGFSGFNYLKEKVDQIYWFSPNETHLAHLFLDPNYMIMPDGQPYSIEALPPYPQLGSLAGAFLAPYHEEESINTAENTATEFLTDGTFRLTTKFSFTAGIRIVFDKSEVRNQANYVSGSPATLGFFTNNYPNVFFRPSDLQSTTSNFSGFTGRLVAAYKVSDNAKLFLTYAKGRRPNVIQYQSDGSSEILAPEIVNSIDLGFKTVVNNQFIFDAVIFYHDYHNFQTNAWIAEPTTGSFAYLIKDGGKATSYGLETSFQYSISDHLKINGNYAYINARYNKVDKDGNPQEYAENTFRLTPDHSFSFSAKYHTKLTRDINLFVIPSLSYRSHFFFEDANTVGIDQDAYMLFNVSTGIQFLDPSLTFSLFVHNLSGKKYLISAGNTGSLFAIPTFVPAIPRTVGLKINWWF